MLRMLTLSQPSGGSPASTPPSPGTAATESVEAMMTATIKEEQEKVVKAQKPAQKERRRSLNRDKKRAIKDSAGSVQRVCQRVCKWPFESPAAVESRGPEVDSWESVATSWLLPDVGQVVWRAALAAGLVTTYVVGLAEREESMQAFSVDAYRAGVTAALLLLVPCGAALACPDDNTGALDSNACAVAWACVTIAFAFASAFAATAATGYLLAAATINMWPIDARHLALPAWLGAELTLSATRIATPHVLASLAVWVAYLSSFAISDHEVPFWLAGFSRFGRAPGFLLAAAVFAAWIATVTAAATARSAVADSLQRRRDKARLPHDEEDNIPIPDTSDKA